MLLSPMEIARICQEQNAAYCRAIGRPDLADPWNDLSNEEKLACEVVVNKILADPNITVTEFKNNVEKIMYTMLVAMVHVLAETN